jgi:hypothetical protein
LILAYLKVRTPADVGLGSRQGECFIGRDQESVADLRAGDAGVIISLLVKIPIRSRPEDVAAFVHRVPFIFRRSSRRRCFSSQ